MEIEAKFLASPDVFATLREFAEIGPFRLQPADHAEEQQNIYYDTPSGRFQQGRYGLRVRHIGSRQIATLKGEAQHQDGVTSRQEYEQDVPGDNPATWPAGELRERVTALAAGEPLAPTVSIRTHREHIYASRAAGEPFAEISLDTGTISAGGAEEDFRELEVELLPDASRADFDELVALLRSHFVLEPEPRSKLARALALRAAQQGQP